MSSLLFCCETLVSSHLVSTEVRTLDKDTWVDFFFLLPGPGLKVQELDLKFVSYIWFLIRRNCFIHPSREKLTYNFWSSLSLDPPWEFPIMPSCRPSAVSSVSSRWSTSTFSGASEDESVVGENVWGQTDGDGRGARQNPFRDVNKIKEPDMIKHEVHYKGNVNLSQILSLSKTVSRRSAAQRRRRIYEASFLNLIEGFRCY